MPKPTPEQLKLRHPEYDRLIDSWTYTLAHYDAARLYADLSTYVPKKALGEEQEAYKERLKITKYAPLVAAVIDSVVGGVSRKEAETVREWGALSAGGIDKLLQRDADRKGTAWGHLQMNKLVDALVFNRVYTLIDTTRTAAGEAGRPFVSIVRPTALVNWREDKDGRLIEALILETVDARLDIFAEPKAAESERFLRLALDGWERFGVVRDERGNISVEVDGVGAWDSPWLGVDGQPRIPLVRTAPRLQRYAAFELAHLANEILNINSELRNILRLGGVGQFLVLAADDEAFANLVARIKEGSRALQEDPDHKGAHRFIGPDMAVVDGLVNTLRFKTEAFWQAALFEFSDRAVERTATEIQAEFAASLGSFLASLAEAADESENDELFLLTQAVGERIAPDAENTPRVQRSKDFTQEDAISVATRIRDLVMGQNNPITITPEIAADVTLAVIERAGLPVKDRERLRQEIVAEAGREPARPAEEGAPAGELPDPGHGEAD